ncbi:hypothetical protein [Actinoplanes sp. NPDC051851]|uniref:hypothetical protein n=1 Tax=Actinoplanes sp. NPDC051851 TaxID=3154753 RepID=UPI0034296E07
MDVEVSWLTAGMTGGTSRVSGAVLAGLARGYDGEAAAGLRDFLTPKEQASFSVSWSPAGEIMSSYHCRYQGPREVRDTIAGWNLFLRALAVAGDEQVGLVHGLGDTRGRFYLPILSPDDGHVLACLGKR